jgi:Bacteriophage holin family
MPKFHLLYLIFKKPVLLLVLVPIVPISNIVDFYSIIKILTYLFILDLFTGICASYFDWKKIIDKKNKWFFGTGEGFSSNKFKKCFVKLIIYCFTPLVMREFQQGFKIKTFTYNIITTADIDLTTVLILLFCINELYSIFHENLPRCGFNIFETIRNIFQIYKSTKKEISE